MEERSGLTAPPATRRDAHPARRRPFWLAVVALAAIPACSYLGAVARQRDLAERQQRDPSLATLKHLLDTETHYVYGRIVDRDGGFAGRQVAVAAYSDAYGEAELVDIMYGASPGTHFGLNLPRTPDAGYRLVVLCDGDGNGRFDEHEVVGEREVPRAALADADDVVPDVDIPLRAGTAARIPAAVAVPSQGELPQSLFYPGGSIRTLDDPLFDRETATLGVYEPAAFSERAPTMFYALEEDVPFKIPVVFVHGIGGTAREFAPLVERLDRSRFKPLFFYYPSGADLGQLAELFYGIFLSGDALGRSPAIPIVIVAHSMGGLVVREALNLLDDRAVRGDIRFLSIASPLAGHAAAALGEQHGAIVVPAWRCLNPASDFLAGLYRRPLPANVRYHLVYAFRDGGLRVGENSDGVVALSSQLRPEAQAEAALQRGFDATHAGILRDDTALAFLLADIHGTRTRFPDEHMQWFRKGGFAVDDDRPYAPQSKYAIETIGRYLWALTTGAIGPVDDEQRHFVDVAAGRVPPANDLEASWRDFARRHPGLGRDGG